MRISSDYSSFGYLRAAIFAPFARLEDAPSWSWFTAVVTATVQLLTDVPLLALLLILTAVSLLDFLLGSSIARRDGVYDANLARGGMIGKATGVLLVLIVWSLEAVISTAGLIDTRGMLATALAVVLLAVEIESFDQHRETLTGKPTPLIRPIIEFLRGIAEGAVPRAGAARKEGRS